MGDVITAYRETFNGIVKPGQKLEKVEPGAQQGGPTALMVLCSGCRAAFALSFGPNGRYVQRGEAAIVPVASLLLPHSNHRAPLSTPVPGG